MKESQLENKTSIATNDYVRMVDENGNSVKIKKDSFMAAIRDALPSIISDGETGGGSVLSIIGGTLKSRTDANLASVLGVKDVGDGLYLVGGLIIGSFAGSYSHEEKINVATQVTSVVASKAGVNATPFIISYVYRGAILLRGIISTTTYAVVEGMDAWGTKWAIWRNNKHDWTDF